MKNLLRLTVLGGVMVLTGLLPLSSRKALASTDMCSGSCNFIHGCFYCQGDPGEMWICDGTCEICVLTNGSDPHAPVFCKG
jgi:hypothetical protein